MKLYYRLEGTLFPSHEEDKAIDDRGESKLAQRREEFARHDGARPSQRSPEADGNADQATPISERLPHRRP